MSQASPSDTTTKSLPHYFTHTVMVKSAQPTHPPANNTNRACLPPQQLLGSRCDSNHAPAISLKLVRKTRQFRHTFSAYVLSRHTSSLTSDHPRYFELFDYSYLIFFRPYLPNKSFQANSTKYSKRNQNVQMFSTTLTVIHKE